MTAWRHWPRTAATVALLFASFHAQAQYRLDSSASPRQQVAALQVLDERGQAFGTNPFARQANAHFGRVEFRLSTAAFIGRRARIDLLLPPQVPGLRNLSGLTYHWRGLDGSLSGQVIPGQRHTLWSGVIEQPFTLLAIELGMRLEIAAMGDWHGGNFGVEPAFELELLP
jgi:hypothetical protein